MQSIPCTQLGRAAGLGSKTVFPGWWSKRRKKGNVTSAIEMGANAPHAMLLRVFFSTFSSPKASDKNTAAYPSADTDRSLNQVWSLGVAQTGNRNWSAVTKEPNVTSLGEKRLGRGSAAACGRLGISPLHLTPPLPAPCCNVNSTRVSFLVLQRYWNHSDGRQRTSCSQFAATRRPFSHITSTRHRQTRQKKKQKNTSESAILQTLSPGQTYCVKPPLAPARNGTRCVDQVWIQESWANLNLFTAFIWIMTAYFPSIFCPKRTGHCTSWT